MDGTCQLLHHLRVTLDTNNPPFLNKLLRDLPRIKFKRHITKPLKGDFSSKVYLVQSHIEILKQCTVCVYDPI